MQSYLDAVDRNKTDKQFRPFKCKENITQKERNGPYRVLGYSFLISDPLKV